MNRTRYIIENGKLKCLGEVGKPSSDGIQIISDTAGYEYDCPVTGRWIDSRTKHKENLKRTDSRVFEKGEKEHFKKTRRAESDRQIQHIVDRSLGYA